MGSSFAIYTIFSAVVFTVVLLHPLVNSSPYWPDFEFSDADVDLVWQTKADNRCILPGPPNNIDSCNLHNTEGFYKSRVNCFQYFFCQWSEANGIWLMYRYECPLTADGNHQEFDEASEACIPGSGAPPTTTEEPPIIIPSPTTTEEPPIITPGPTTTEEPPIIIPSPSPTTTEEPPTISPSPTTEEPPIISPSPTTTEEPLTISTSSPDPSTSFSPSPSPDSSTSSSSPDPSSSTSSSSLAPAPDEKPNNEPVPGCWPWEPSFLCNRRGRRMA